ncbi:MAG TPA: dihydroorotate dehydrogenase [Candidatus Sulfotelmatobacter sp.]|nr:dihydroorotate dehydrogenase [Candidatus Sulfotelmatobacter sp.]
MSKNLLNVNFAGLKLASPTILASGILGYSGDMLNCVAKMGAGAVVTKSVGVEPRPGYPNPTVVQVEAGLINAMGLPNPGINDFAEEISYAKTLLKVPLIVSVFGYSADEYAAVAEKAAKAGADAVELNVSCPHVKDTGHEIGQHPKTLEEVVEKVKQTVKSSVIVKLSPNVTDIVEIARAAVRAGADALTATNTMKAVAIDVETQMPILSNVKGGLSGPAIKPITLRCVYDLFEADLKVPIFGCGGITTWRDAVEFLLAGAVAVQIGTGVSLEDLSIFENINKGVKSYLQRKGYRSVNEIVGLCHQI